MFENAVGQLDIRKFLETLAWIIGEREGVEITVVSIERKEKPADSCP